MATLCHHCQHILHEFQKRVRPIDRIPSPQTRIDVSDRCGQLDLSSFEVQSIGELIDHPLFITGTLPWLFGVVAFPMSKILPIETALGRLDGRDCISLNAFSYQDDEATLQVDGSINGNLCSIRKPGRFIPYSVRFYGMIALKMTVENLWNGDFESSFDEVVDSNWPQLIGYREAAAVRHFILQTYDDIFEVLCTEYEFEIFNDVD